MNRAEANAEYERLCMGIGIAIAQGPDLDDSDSELVASLRDYVNRKKVEARALHALIEDGEFGDGDEPED